MTLANSPGARRLLLPNGSAKHCFSSSEPGVKHAHNLKPILSGRAGLTPGSEEEKAKAGEPRASLHTDLSSLISVIGVIRVQ